MNAINDIASERERQISERGYTQAHDDEMNGDGELVLAAVCYAKEAAGLNRERPQYWPWSDFAWKPGGYRQNLVKAAALIAAEIDRIDRHHTGGTENGITQ